MHPKREKNLTSRYSGRKKSFMSHLIETMAYVGEKPWHGLGIEVQSGISVPDMLQVAGLNWTVIKAGLRTEQGVHLKDNYALIRSTDNAELGVCGKEYVPTQNSEAFEFFDSFCKAGQMKLETAGSLMGGKKVFGLAKTSFGFDLGNDEVNDYVLLYSPHIWGKSLTIMHTSIRVVCNNTLTSALRGATMDNAFRFLHTVKFEAVVQEIAREKLNLIAEKSSLLATTAKILATKYYTEDDCYDFLMQLFPGTDKTPFSRTAQEVISLIDTQPGANLPSSEGTFWGLYNAVTFWADHRAGRLQDNRFDSALFGQNNALKQKALDLALKIAV